MRADNDRTGSSLASALFEIRRRSPIARLKIEKKDTSDSSQATDLELDVDTEPIWLADLADFTQRPLRARKARVDYVE